MLKILISAIVILFAISLGYSSANEALENNDVQKELIILAAPISGDPYYADQAENIFEFHVE